jgi:sarcosine oxidase
MPSWDVIVVGLGAMGSAIAAELASRGSRVLGLDQFDPPHALGSSHGETRIIREAYFEHPLYVPLVQRAYERWAALEAASGERLLVRTGGLSIGPPDGTLVSGALASAREHGLAHERLSADEVTRDHPVLRLEPQWVAVREPRAGVLFPERCIAAQLACAGRAGATLRTRVPVTGWFAGDAGVTVEAGGERLSAGRLVIAAGAWLRGLLAGADAPIAIERQVVHWFDAGSAADHVGPEALPVFLIEDEPSRYVYGFPRLDEVGPGVKVSRHHEGETTTAEAVSREVGPGERDAIDHLRRRYLPSVDGPHLRSSVCLYTNTPDQHFLIDIHPRHPEVLVVSPCSGHGFKFASVIGEVAADLVTTGHSRFDLAPFRWGRWAR